MSTPPAMDAPPDPPTTNPARAGRAATSSDRRSPRAILFKLGLLAALLVLTGWNVTRSPFLAEAEAAYTKRDLPSCLQRALDHLGRRPWSREASVLAARCLSQLDFADEAEPYYRRAGRLSLDDLQVRAYGLVRGNHRERAIQAYEQILARSPNNVTALRRLAAVQLSRNDNEALMALSDRLIRIPEGAAVGYTLLGVVQHNSENPEASTVAFERVLALDPQLRSMPLPRSLFWAHLVDDLVAVGRISDARRYLTRVVEETPEARHMIVLGRVYDLEGNREEAERCWRLAAEWQPRSYVPILNLGRLALQRKRDREALALLKKAEELAPEVYETSYLLAQAYQRVGQETEAARYRKRAEALRGKPAQPAQERRTTPLPSYAL